MFSGELEQISNELFGFAEPLRDEIGTRDREKGRVVRLRCDGLGKVRLAGSGRAELKNNSNKINKAFSEKLNLIIRLTGIF